jgi:hypothetical protein
MAGKTLNCYLKDSAAMHHFILLLKHIAPLELIIIFDNAIDILPRWGKSDIEISRYPKPEIPLYKFFTATSSISIRTG